MSDFRNDIIKRFERVITKIKENKNINLSGLKKELNKIEKIVSSEKKVPRRLSLEERRKKMDEWRVLYSMNEEQLKKFFYDKDKFKDIDEIKDFLFGFLSSRVLLKVKNIGTIVKHVYNTISKKPNLHD